MKFNEVYLRPVSPCLFVLVPHLKATDGNQKEIQKKWAINAGYQAPPCPNCSTNSTAL